MMSNLILLLLAISSIKTFPNKCGTNFLNKNYIVSNVDLKNTTADLERTKNDLDNTKIKLSFEKIYPIGSIYLSINLSQIYFCSLHHFSCLFEICNIYNQMSQLQLYHS